MKTLEVAVDFSIGSDDVVLNPSGIFDCYVLNGKIHIAFQDGEKVKKTLIRIGRYERFSGENIQFVGDFFNPLDGKRIFIFLLDKFFSSC